jgi:Ni,Fe-hydrogenase III large subunit/NADH:ubiquinone oxidoreductase subunit C
MMVTPSPAGTPPSFDAVALVAEVEKRFGPAVSPLSEDGGTSASFLVGHPPALISLCEFLFKEAGCSFGGLIVEEREEWNLRYVFLNPRSGWVHCILRMPLDTRTVPSISVPVNAADWYEREAEDLFGLAFEEHPRLGDFVLHDQVWQEGLTPMRKAFNARQTRFEKRPQEDWRPVLVVQDPGSFAMPVGPVYEGGVGESVHFLLETVGEDVIRAVPRLFYNHRAVEKIAEGKSVLDALLLAERFSAKSAFAHSLGFCQAVEKALHLAVPQRASRLRVVLCELERLRHHAGVIEGICKSTALAVPEAHSAIVEEQLLRVCGRFSGHRYLFGLNTPGGLRRDFDEQALSELLQAVDGASAQLERLEGRLRYSSSFLDRLEDVGVVSTGSARHLNLLGPVGRASGLRRDLRRVCPYSGYEQYRFEVPTEEEGDGYARLRVLFSEARQSAGLIHQAVESMEPGEVATLTAESVAAAALGWVEAPIGAAGHWVRLDSDGKVERYRILSPSFRNWMGLHIAAEDFAFQDFPIILATFGLSATECDR